MKFGILSDFFDGLLLGLTKVLCFILLILALGFVISLPFRVEAVKPWEPQCVPVTLETVRLGA